MTIFVVMISCVLLFVILLVLDAYTDIPHKINEIFFGKKHQSEAKRFEELIEKEIQKLEKKMQDVGFSFPIPESEETKKDFLKRCLFRLYLDFSCSIKGYRFDIINPCNGMRVLYDKKRIYVMTDKCCDFVKLDFMHDKRKDKIAYFYKTVEDKIIREVKITLDEVFSRFEKEFNLDYIRANSRGFDLTELRWHVGGLDSSAYKLANIGSSAVVGGLLFGGTGALIGAVKANNDQTKNPNADRFIRFGPKYSNDWIVSYAYEFNETFKFLDKNFSDYREPDQYK